MPPAIQSAGASIAPLEVAIPEEGCDARGYIDKLERDVIARALEKTGVNKGAAAKLLNLRRPTLVEKLKRMGRDDGAVPA
jgi:sigma-54 specific flagellar transcriptional regulator A